MKMQNYKTIDEYISNFPAEKQEILEAIRAAIKEVAPNAEETIGYGIPTFKLKGKNLVHFGGYDSHYAIYPGPASIEVLKDELGAYETAKGTVRFPADKPVPYELIKKLTLVSVERIQGRK